MKYQSTRGGSTNSSFESVLFSGYAPDGGLFVPSSIPHLSKDQLKSWSSLSYPELAKRFLPFFIDAEEISPNELDSIVDEAFGQHKFQLSDIAPLVDLKGFRVLELFHGPTLAFKDLALTLVGLFLRHFLRRNNRHVTILVGTSGDTGSASIEAVRGSSMADIVVLLPRGRCTEIQERQMTSVLDDNVHVYRVDGTSDDLDVPIKRCFDDPAFSAYHNLISLNSINWARVLVQAVHFIYAFLRVNPNVDEEKKVEFIVPTGACGNVSGGVLAVCMGVPMSFVTAVTVNDIVHRAVDGADFSMAPEVIPTLAPSIDIQVPYNMERIYFFCTDGDHHTVSSIMSSFESTGASSLPPPLHSRLRSIVSGFLASDDVIVDALQRVKRENDYVVCPHTAVAVAAFYASQKLDNADSATNIPVVVATASPAKFPEALRVAGLEPVKHPKIEQVMKMKTKFVDLEAGQDWTKILKEKIEEISSRCDREREAAC